MEGGWNEHCNPPWEDDQLYNLVNTLKRKHPRGVNLPSVVFTPQTEAESVSAMLDNFLAAQQRGECRDYDEYIKRLDDQGAQRRAEARAKKGEGAGDGGEPVSETDSGTSKVDFRDEDSIDPDGSIRARLMSAGAFVLARKPETPVVHGLMYSGRLYTICGPPGAEKQRSLSTWRSPLRSTDGTSSAARSSGGVCSARRP